jgi:hypothetical protein
MNEYLKCANGHWIQPGGTQCNVPECDTHPVSPEQAEKNQEIKDYVAEQTPTSHYVAPPGAPGFMPPAPPTQPAKKKMDPGVKAVLFIVLALVLGGAAFGGYTLIQNNAEKTACEQLADDTVYTVNPSHAWDLYEIYMAAPSGSAAERTALNAVGSFCSDRGVSLSRASWYTGSESYGSQTTQTTQPTYNSGGSGYGSGGYPYFPVTQASDSGSTQMAAAIAADYSSYWTNENTGSTVITSSAVCAPSSSSSWQFNCNITFTNGSYGSYWVSWSSSTANGEYMAVHRTS